MADILGKVNKSTLSTFKKDLGQLIRVAFGMDKGYGAAYSYVDNYMPKYESLVKLFNEKYNKLHFKIRKKGEELQLLIFVDEKSVKDVFQNAASKIAGLKSIGSSGFGKADVSNADDFSGEMGKLKSKLYLTYYEEEPGSNTVLLEYSEQEKKVMVHYEFKGITDERSPAFKLLAYYAAMDFDPKLDVYNKGAEIGFTDLLSDKERREWSDMFNPRWTE